MKKTISLLLFFILAGLCAYGKAVPESTLKAAGSNFLISMDVSGVKSGADLSIAYTGTGTYKGSTATALYVFTVNSGKGWVMMSADDRVKPILAYSDKSGFDINRVASATAAWVHTYEAQIACVINSPTPPTAETTAEWNDLTIAVKRSANRTTSVSPLLTTTWDQYPYYDDLCPYSFPDSELTVTGCVATAMAQVMKYWNWPSVGVGFHAYLDTPYGTLSANFAAAAYQWSSMPNIISSPDTAVATLMYQAGVSVNMIYGANASAACTPTIYSNYTPCAEFALRANFHYKKSLHSILRFGGQPGINYPGYDSIGETTWISDLKAELDAGRPIIYLGDNAAAGGHTWVCDGYNSTNYFHFNWGWSGYADGYFTVDNIDPPGFDALGFDLWQGAIIGIEPDSFTNYPGNIELLSPLNTSNTPFRYGQPFSVSAKIVNTGTSGFAGDFCAVMVDTNNNTLPDTIRTLGGETIAAGDSTAMLTFSSAGNYSLVTGLYNVCILYRSSGSVAWTPVANNGNFINFTYMAIYDDTNIYVADPISLSDGTTLYQNEPVSLSTYIWDNWGTANFYGNIRATLNSITDGAPVFTIQEFTGQEIDLGAINPYTFFNSSLTVPTGAYALEIQHQYNGLGSYFLTGSTVASNPILVNVVLPSSITQLSNSGDVNIYPNPTSTMLYLNMNGAVSAKITIMDMAGRQMQDLSSGNEPIVSIPLSGYPAGVYFLQIQTTDEVATKKFVVLK